MPERIARSQLVGGGLNKGTMVALLLGGLCAFMLVAGALVLASEGDSGINNCCYNADWVCNTQNEWDEGYYAFLNGQCVVGQSQSESSEEESQSVAATAAAPASVSAPDNCCYNADWRCTTQTEWVEGFYSARRNTCHIKPAVWAADATPSVQATERPRRQQSGSSEIASSEADTERISGYDDVKVYDQHGNEVDDVVVRRPTRQELCDAGLVEHCDEE